MRSAVLGFVVTMLAASAFACSDDTPAPSGPLPGDVIAADASPDDVLDASRIDLDAATNASADSSTGTTGTTTTPDATSSSVPDSSTFVDDDSSVDGDF